MKNNSRLHSAFLTLALVVTTGGAAFSQEPPAKAAEPPAVITPNPGAPDQSVPDHSGPDHSVPDGVAPTAPGAGGKQAAPATEIDGQGPRERYRTRRKV